MATFQCKLPTHPKNNIIPKEYLRNFSLTTVFPALSCYCFMNSLIFETERFPNAFLNKDNNILSYDADGKIFL